MSTSAREEEVLAKIGQVVLVSQAAERAIQFCMTFVLQKESPLTIEALKSQQAAERRKTIGYFLGQLRQRADVREDLDQLLTSFLEKRNMLIHRVNEIEGWHLHHHAGRQAAMHFLDELGALAVQILKVFLGLVRAWQAEAGIDPSLPSGGEALLAEIDSKYLPLVDHLFFERNPR